MAMQITAFIPEVWSAQLLVDLEKSHVYAGLVNRNYEGEISEFGDTVHITSLNDPTIGTYSAHTDINVDPVTDTSQTFVIDQSKYFAFEVDDIEQRQARGDVMDEQARKAGYLLADTTDKYLASTMAGGAGNTLSDTGSSTTAATASKVNDMLLDAKLKLDQQNVPTQGRWVVVPPAAERKLLTLDLFVTANQSGTTTALRNGQIGRAYGFDIIMSNNVPVSTSGTPSEYSVLAGYDGATTFAEQISKVEAFSMEKRFNDAVKGLHLYGSKVIRSEGLVLAPTWL